LLILGLIVIFLSLPHIEQAEAKPVKKGDPVASTSIWTYKHTVLGAVGIFLYVGVEVGLASIAVNYFLSQGVDSARVTSFFDSLGGFGTFVTGWLGPWTNVEIAAILVSLYWFGALIGRLLGSWILTVIKSGKLLGIFGFAAAVSIALSMVTNGQIAIWTLVLCGFFNSIMFPNIFALGIAGLGKMASKGSGLIMTAVVGGAVVPWLIGAVAEKIGKHYAIVHNLQYVPGGLADKVGIQSSFAIPILCYLFIAYYGLWGSKPTRTVAA